MLTRWDPFREMMALRSTMDHLFDSALAGSQTFQPLTWELALDVVENTDEYVVKASTPGINPDDLEITFANNTLTIKGDVKEDKEYEEARYHVRERRHGSFSRSLSLPSGIEGDKIQASYENGVLKLRLPKAEEIKPKKITVHSAKMIEGKVSDIKSKN